MFTQAAILGYHPNTPDFTAKINGTVAADAGGGSIAWTAGPTGGNVVLPDLSDSANRLNVTAYGFAIPEFAVITGIEMEISRHNTGTSAAGIGGGYKLLKAGSAVGILKGDTLMIAPAGGGYAVGTFGSSADLWGTTWTPAEINASNFGLQFATITKNANDGLILLPQFNAMTLKIYYKK